MNIFRKYIGDFFVTTRFYQVGIGLVACFFISYFETAIFPVVRSLTILFFILCGVDYIFLFFINKSPAVKRILAERLSNGDINTVNIRIKNRMPWPVYVTVIDELPVQLQWRNFNVKEKLDASGSTTVTYILRPLQRGEYYFEHVIVFVSSLLHLVQRRYETATPETVKVYPSFINLKNIRLMSQGTHMQQSGSRRIRKIGQSMEFEQVKDYVTGDDIRTINWKATARRNQLMVNNYVDEKSQQVYCIIDKGRLMQMPFNGLSLLDYSINSALALSNVCLQKQDKIGLLSFSHKMGTQVPADRKPVQQEILLQALYNEKTTFQESDFEMLYTQVRHTIKQRSLLILFTNFESLTGLGRQLNYLRSIARHHLLLVVFFENTELNKMARKTGETLEEVYNFTIAEKFAFEKKMLVKELQKYGIISVLTAPENLTVNAINKYLEIKTRQAI